MAFMFKKSKKAVPNVSTHMASVDSSVSRCVGPYLLTRTLGKGQTGVVKLGIHCSTGKQVAVKIVNRTKLSQSVLNKVEREIAIMKLIDHPNVLGLYDVYENNSYLYLVLEYVSGGELFDYLVKKIRLPEREARKFFRQIVSAVDFCHKHQTCHRDLKPENLLLDDKMNIKVADFGMASLQVHDKLLETSCGSPHYACPEVIRGEHYDGRKADVWSCGIILYALLVGQLPFDDDNLRVLLEKVKKGSFHIPSFLPPPVHHLIRGMVESDPRKRMTMKDVMTHPWTRGSHGLELEMATPMQKTVETVPLQHASEIDPDIIKLMTSLGCFKDKALLMKALMSREANEEKVVYFLLLYRKEKAPEMGEDDMEATMVTGHVQTDPPRKRKDSVNLPSIPVLARVRSNSVSNSPEPSPLPSPEPHRPPRFTHSGSPLMHQRPGYHSYQGSPVPDRKSRLSQPNIVTNSLDTPPRSPWRNRISATLKSTFGSPHFHRRRMDPGSDDLMPSGLASPDPEPVKRSWFANFLSNSGDKSEVHLVISDKTESELKSALQKAFETCGFIVKEVDIRTYKVKYDSKGKSLVKKTTKFSVHFEVTDKGVNGLPERSSSAGVGGTTHTLTFSLINGSPTKFKKLTDRIQVAMLHAPDSGHESPETPTLASEELISVIKSDSDSPISKQRIVAPTKKTSDYRSMFESSDEAEDSDEGILSSPKKI